MDRGDTFLFPIELRALLEHQSALFVGRSIGTDASFLLADWGVNMMGIRLWKAEISPKHGVYQDLQKVCKDRYPDLPDTKLATLTREILGHHLPKGEQQSNWSAKKLSQDQIRYAALDARASLLVFQAVHDPFHVLPILTDCTACKNIECMIKLDPFHAMDRIIRIIPKGHSYLSVFSKDLRDAIFMTPESKKSYKITSTSRRATSPFSKSSIATATGSRRVARPEFLLLQFCSPESKEC